MKIKIVDTFCIGSVHAQFNASLLSMLAMINENVDYYASPTSKEKVFKLSNWNHLANLNFYPIYVWGGNGGFNLLMRYIISVIQNVRFLLTSSTEDILIYNFNNVLSLSFLNFINKFINRKILVFCHGEMELLLAEREKGGGLHRILRYSLINFFISNKNIHKNIMFCVIGEVVINNLKQLISKENYSHFVYMDHPYIYQKKANEIHFQNNDILSIGMVGTFSLSKGACDFLEIVKKQNEKKQKVNFSITGQILYGIEELKDLNVNIPLDNGKGMVSEEEFAERISSLHYILFLYPTYSYRLIASGAIMDALNWRKPILALKNQYFEYIFDKFGAFGYLFDSTSEIIDFINSDKIPPSQQFDFENIIKKTSPESLVFQLKEILNSIT